MIDVLARMFLAVRDDTRLPGGEELRRVYTRRFRVPQIADGAFLATSRTGDRFRQVTGIYYTDGDEQVVVWLSPLSRRVRAEVVRSEFDRLAARLEADGWKPVRVVGAAK